MRLDLRVTLCAAPAFSDSETADVLPVGRNFVSTKTNRAPSRWSAVVGLNALKPPVWGVDIVHTLGFGSGRTGVGSGRIPYVSAGPSDTGRGLCLAQRWPMKLCGWRVQGPGKRVLRLLRCGAIRASFLTVLGWPWLAFHLFMSRGCGDGMTLRKFFQVVSSVRSIRRAWGVVWRGFSGQRGVCTLSTLCPRATVRLAFRLPSCNFCRHHFMQVSVSDGMTLRAVHRFC